MSERNTVIPIVSLLLKNNGKILLTRRHCTGYYDDWLSPPARHVEFGETAREAVVRETAEEVGIKLGIDDIAHVYTLFRADEKGIQDYVNIFFMSKEDVSEVPSNIEPDKCSEIVWVDIENLASDVCHIDAVVIERIKQGKVYSEMNREEVLEYHRLYEASCV